MNFWKQHRRFCFHSTTFTGPRSLLSSFRHHQDLSRASGPHNGTQVSLMSTDANIAEFEQDQLVDDSEARQKDKALQLALKQLAGDFSKESMLSLSHFFRSRRAPVISTGSLKLDQALGIGGLPKGRMVEIYGKEASGKTTLALHIIKEAQKLGGYCAYLDAENAMDPVLAESIGVKTDDLLLACPDSAENMLSVVDTLTKSGAVDVVVVDSVAALVPQYELDDTVEHGRKHGQSEIMNKALRKIHYSLCQSNTLLVFLNQVRSYVRPGQGFGCAQEVTCGGNALKFYAAVRLRISRMKLLMSEDKVTGLGICVQVVKNKLAPVMKKAELKIQFGRGIPCESEVLEMACEHGLIERQGYSYCIGGEILDDQKTAESYLAQNESVRDNMIKDLRTLMFEV